MPTRPISRAEAQRSVREVERALREGYRPPGVTGRGLGAIARAAERLGMPAGTLQNRLRSVERVYGLVPDWSLSKPPAGEVAPSSTAVDAVRRAEVAERRASEAERKAEALAAEMEALRRDPGNPAAIAEALGVAREHAIEPPDWLLRPQRSDDTPGVPVALWSDWHIGETVDPAQTYGMNGFNEALADERVKRLVERTIHLACDRMVNPTYPGIVLWLGGDMVSGWLHQELVATDWCSPPEAVSWCVSRLRWAIERLTDAFQRVMVICSPGNHGRITQKPMAKGGARASYDHLIYAHLAELFRGHPEVSIHAAADGEALVQIGSTRFLFMHGHELGVKGGDGLIGSLGPIMRGRIKAGRSQATVGRDFDVLVLGHFHRAIWQPADGVIVNGTLKGWDEYARVQRYAWAAASQTLFFVHPVWGPIHPFEVFLQARPARKPVEFAALAEG